MPSVASNTGPRAPTSPSTTPPREKFSRRLQSGNETSCSGKRKKQPPASQAPRALHHRPSRRPRLDSAARRHDRVPLAGEQRERPPVLPGRTEHGVLLAPGDCFVVPSHFRVGFAVAGASFSEALE